MLTKIKKCFSFVLLVAVMIFFVCPLHAQEEGTIDELMSGFDDQGSESSDSELNGFDEEEEVDDLLEGFEEDIQRTEGLDDGSEFFPSLPFSLDGYVKIGSTYNFDHDKPEGGKTDWRGLPSLRTEMLLELSWKFSNSWQAFVSGKGFYDFAYEINGRDGYTNDVLEDYEKEVELREAWVQGKLTDFLDIKVGRQIVVWGRSDNARITDVLNPLDMREPGMTDIEDLRLPLWMTRVDAYFGNWNLTGIAIHEMRFNKTPPYGTDFYPEINPLSGLGISPFDFESFLSGLGISPFDLQSLMPKESMPQHGGDNTEYAVALNGNFSGWDISFYWANFYNDLPHFDIDLAVDVDSSFPPPMFQGSYNYNFELKHARVNMVGSAFNVTKGNWLFKGEAAYFSGLRFYNVDIDADINVNMPGLILDLEIDEKYDKKYYRTDALLGIEYSGFENTTISIDAANRYITNYDEILELPPIGVKENEFQWFIRLSRNFMNETLTLNFLAAIYGWKGQDGAVERFWAEYDLTDNIKATGGVVFFESGELINFRNIGKNDRLFLEIKYSF